MRRAELMCCPAASLPHRGVVADDFGDDEVQEFLGELRVEVSLRGKLAQTLDLFGFTSRIGRRHAARRLERADLFREFEALGQKVDQRGIDVVDALADAQELFGDLGLRHAAFPMFAGQTRGCGAACKRGRRRLGLSVPDFAGES